MKKKTEGRKYRWAVPFRNSLMLNGQGYGIIDPRFYDSKPLWPLIHMLYFLSIFAYSFDFAEIFAKKLRSVNDTAEPSFAVSLTLWSQTKVFCNFCQIFLLQYIKRQFHEICYTVFHDSSSKTYFRTVLRFWRYCSAVLMLKNGTAFAVSMTPRSKKLMSSQIRSHIRKTCKKSIRDTKLGYS